MPKQETFLRENVGSLTVDVTKTYDPSYAREVFAGMQAEAKQKLANALEIAEKYAPEDIPDPEGFEYDDFLWEELSEQSLEDARQSPRLYSFFVVTVTQGGKAEDQYVSADWPSAESYAKERLAELSAAS